MSVNIFLILQLADIENVSIDFSVWFFHKSFIKVVRSNTRLVHFEKKILKLIIINKKKNQLTDLFRYFIGILAFKGCTFSSLFNVENDKFLLFSISLL